MTTTLNMVNETKRHLLASTREVLNQLAGAITAEATTLTLAHSMGSVQRGAVLSIDLELVYVWSVSGQVATVQRAYGGSTAAAHSDLATVEVNSLSPTFSILGLLNNELVSFSSPTHGLFRVATVDLTYSPARSGYDLTGVTDLQGIVAVEAADVMPGDRVPLDRWRLIRNQAPADFPSGYVLYLFEGAMPGRTIRVTYKRPYGALSTLSDDVLATTGLQPTAHDIPPLGAAARILAGRESRRMAYDAQPEPRAAADVPPSGNTSAMRSMLALRAQRLNEEATRLAAFYPARTRV